MLTDTMKEKWMEVRAKVLLHYEHEGDQFLLNTATGDEGSWHHYKPECMRRLNGVPQQRVKSNKKIQAASICQESPAYSFL